MKRSNKLHAKSIQKFKHQTWLNFEGVERSYKLHMKSIKTFKQQACFIHWQKDASSELFKR
uniref:Uncharacterized protein n=1 Tax=Solanum tuberosum TaxID=4113 RepID=M1ALB3_SOLTU